MDGASERRRSGGASPLAEAFASRSEMAPRWCTMRNHTNTLQIHLTTKTHNDEDSMEIKLNSIDLGKIQGRC